jgi:phosphohistidine phosphatase
LFTAAATATIRGIMAALTSHLFIVRHAIAEDVAPDGADGSRRLTRRGRRRFARLVRRLARGGMAVDVIATSPLVRTRETAEILADGLLQRPRVEIVEPLAPGADWQRLVEWTVARGGASVAWVGHAPCVGRLVAASIGDGTAAVRMEKGAVASIALPDGLGHPGELEWLVVPELLRRR